MKNTLPSNRSFGWTFVVFFALAGCWSAWQDGVAYMALFPLCAITGTVLFFKPEALGPLNRQWMVLAELLHRLVSPVMLAVVFYAVFTPVGLLMRSFGRDPMKRKYEPGSDSYWIDREPPGPADDSFREQF